MIQWLLLLPCLGALLAFVVRHDRVRRGVLVTTAVVHFGMVILAWIYQPATALNGWLGLDAAGLFFLSTISLLFLAAAVYASGYLKQEAQGKPRHLDSGMLFYNAPEAVFTGCLLLFLATMTLVSVSQHFGLLWVAVEATTLASAPLIYFHRHDRSLEATWKYLLICSVGIAVALLGTFFLAVSATGLEQNTIPLIMSDLVSRSSELNIPWLKAAFIFLIVGYGTKMGLAPMHTWLPDAHSEAPAVVSALLSGALLNCAFLGILRMQEICTAAGQRVFGQDVLIAFGLMSMTVAAVFIIKQKDFKRLLAYSSIEHMGIMVLGLGLGGVGIYGAIFHSMNHAFTKGMLFLAAGNILAVYRTKSGEKITGLWHVLPMTGTLWVLGFLAITGSPPFGMFWSELLILKAALENGHPFVATAYLFLLAIIFVAMAKIVLPMAQGDKTKQPIAAAFKEKGMLIAPAAILGGLVLILGLHIPSFLQKVMHEASALFGGF